MIELRGPAKYLLGLFAIASALLIAVEVSLVVGIILGGIAVLVLPWVPVTSRSDAGD
jgi:hypothetical protein